MILATLQYKEKAMDFWFPSSERELMENLRTLGAVDSNDDIKSVFVTQVKMPLQLKTMEKLYVDPDEVNYLAKRMSTFCKSEQDQFLAALEVRPLSEPRDLINMTFNLNMFTLIKDISSYAKIGYAYTLNTQGSADPFDAYNEKYKKIGISIINSGEGVFTEKGLMFVTPGRMESVYDSTVFPPLNTKSYSMLEVRLHDGYADEFLYLPEETTAIKKALKRLDVSSLDECTVEIDNCNLCPDSFTSIVKDVLEKYDLFEVNDMLNSITNYHVDLNKLALAIEYFDVREPENIVSIAKHLKSFNYIEGIESERDLAEYYFINIADGDKPSFPSLSEVGIYILEHQKGNFLNNVYVYFDHPEEYEEILDVLNPEDNEMVLGGM